MLHQGWVAFAQFRSLSRSLFLLHFLLVIAPSTWGSGANAQVFRVDPTIERFDLSTELALLRDPVGNMRFEDVVQRKESFQLASRRDLVTSFNPGVFWLRVSLENPGTTSLDRWLVVGTSKIQRVTLYVSEGDGWQTYHSGRAVALRDKPIVALDPVFPLRLNPGETRELLLRVDSRGAADMVTELWEPHAYRHAVSRWLMQLSAILVGLLFSGSLALIAFAYLREAQYAWLGLVLLGIAGLEASRENFIGTYFWPQQWPLPPQILALFALVALFGLSKVVSRALDLPQRMPQADRLLLALRWLAVAGMLLAMLSYGHGVRILSLVSIVQNSATLVLCALAWYRGQTVARMFLLAFSLALLTEIARQLANLGLLPWTAPMEFSTLLFLLASPLILWGLAEQTRQLREKLAVAEQLDAAKSAFFARINHELRSPLNSILGVSRMLARGSKRLSLAEGTANIERNALRLLRLIDELLDAARAAAGHLSIRPVPLALRPWLEEIAQDARLVAAATGHRLECEFAGDLDIRIEADGERLRQVLDNLLNNASRHGGKAGEVRFTCTVSLDRPDARLDFSVQDSGPGIDTARVQQIFEPFMRGPTNAMGHGLGLSICRELVRQMGSDIQVISRPGQGACFAFSLRCPLLGSSSSSLPQFRRQSPLITAAAKGSPLSPLHTRPRVLLVDDEPAQLAELAETLDEAGFDTTTALGGRIALEQTQQTAWDLLITDQMMPDVDGWSLLRQVSAIWPQMPVVLLSAVQPSPPVAWPHELNFATTLLKPVTPTALAATLWYLLLNPNAVLTDEAWLALATLANEGDVSGIEDWLASHGPSLSNDGILRDWIEAQLHRLNLSLLETFVAVWLPWSNR